MRRMFKRTALRLADWLAYKADDLRAVADDLRDWAWEPGLAQNNDIGCIIAAAMANRSGAMAENLTRNNALLKRLANG